MADYIFNLPDIGEGIATAEIVAWHVKAGDVIREDQPLADMMTDKATVEISAPRDGKVLTLAGDVGDEIPIGAMLVTLDIGGDEPESGIAPPVDETSDQGSDDDEAGQERPIVHTAPEPVQLDSASARPLLASPAVRARARALGVDLAQVKPAQGDRIRHADLDSFITYNRGYAPAGGRRSDEQVKVIGLRRRIAENMAASKRHIPHFTYVEEIDVTKLEALREDLNATRGNRPKLTLLPLLIVALCRVLPEFPMINARYDDEAGVVTRHGAVHLGMATQTDAGLMVPVIRDAQDRNIWQLATEILRLAEAARSGTAKLEELSGSTLTITSLGPLGGIATTPVINRPEVAVIGPNRIVERPVFRDGKVEAAKLMNLSISCDHRVLDGWDAASFVQALKRLMETPALIFVD
jgi:2-oxoisovalerate dehydrogenase E2 component (dihydrolipoyl transacylase)